MADTKISALPASTTPLAGTEVLPIVQGGVTKQVSVANLTAGRPISATELTLTTGNLIVANGQGIDFSATSGTGTSELLSDYEEGTWTPTQGAGLTVVGAFSSNGKYVKIGTQVTVTGFVAGATSVALAAGTSLAAGLPFTASQTPVDYSLGSATNATNSISTTVLTSGGTVFGTDLIAATPKIYFTITYISV
jgi:hypothetical protein